jgi:hypothetical protein
VNNNALQEQLAWVGDNCEKFAFYRQQGYSPDGVTLQSSYTLLKQLLNNQISDEWQQCAIPNEHEAVMVETDKIPTTIISLNQEESVH